MVARYTRALSGELAISEFQRSWNLFFSIFILRYFYGSCSSQMKKYGQRIATELSTYSAYILRPTADESHNGVELFHTTTQFPLYCTRHKEPLYKKSVFPVHNLHTAKLVNGLAWLWQRNHVGRLHDIGPPLMV